MLEWAKEMGWCIGDDNNNDDNNDGDEYLFLRVHESKEIILVFEFENKIGFNLHAMDGLKSCQPPTSQASD